MADIDNKYQADVSQKIFRGAKKFRGGEGLATTGFDLAGGFGKKFKPERHHLLDYVNEYRSANIILSLPEARDKIILRGEKNTLADAVKKILDLPMPKPLHYSANKKGVMLSWVSPDEWLLNLPLSKAAETMQALSKSLAGKHHALVDVSDYYVDIVLKGAASLPLISKGSPINVDERFLTVGQVVSTHYANASIVLTYLEKEFEMQVRSSFASYLWEYLIVAAKEFG